MSSSIQTLTLLILTLALVIVAVASAVVLRRRASAKRQGLPEFSVFPVRSLDAYAILPDMVGQAIEADRPLLLSTGASRLGDDTTVLTLATLEMVYYTAKEVAIGQTAPIYMTSETSVIPLGYDTLRRAYENQGYPVRSSLLSVRWYPSEVQSLVFAAMLTVTMASDNAAGNVLVGRFGPELALPLAASQRRGVESIAGSDDIVGQAVAFAMADGPLIGEDAFSAAGYLGEKSSERGGLVAQDFLRGILIASILLIAAFSAGGERLGNLLAPVLNLFGG